MSGLAQLLCTQVVGRRPHSSGKAAKRPGNDSEKLLCRFSSSLGFIEAKPRWHHAVLRPPVCQKAVPRVGRQLPAPNFAYPHHRGAVPV